MNQRKYLSFVLIILIHSSLCFACNNEPADKQSIKDQLMAYLKEKEKDGFHGTVLVSKKNEVLIKAGFGKANIAAGELNTAKTIIPIGSISKQFTAAGILVLESQNKLHLDDKLSSYFQNVPADKEKITLHHLLSHTSGLEGSLGFDFEAISEQDYLTKVWDSNLKSRIGTKFNYSNVGYSLLAMIIEDVTNQSYEKFMIDNIFKPANMNDTGYTLPLWKDARFAHLYGKDGKDNGVYKDQEYFPTWHIKGNGGFLSRVDDLYQWYLTMKNQKILSPEAWNKMLTPYKNNYGYGWDILKNGNLIQHNGGSLAGVSSEFRWFKKEDVFIAVLSNNIEWGFSIDKIRDKLAKIALK